MKKHAFLIFLSVTFSNCFAKEKLIWTYNATTNIMTAYDRASFQVSVLDADHDKSCLYDGTTGAAFIFDYENRTGVYIKGGLSDKTWYKSQQKFEDYFLSLPSQNILYELGEKKGVAFDESTITGELSGIIADILTPLSPEYSDSCESFQTYIGFCKTNGNSLTSSLEGFSEVMGNIYSEIRGDFKWLVQIFTGFGTFFGEFNRGLSLLKNADIKLDFREVLNDPTGIDVLNYILKQMAPKLDVGEILGHALNCEQHFFQLVNGLGANMTYQVDGFLNIISKIEDFIHGDCPMHEVISIIYAYYNNPSTDPVYVKNQSTRAVRDLLHTIEKLNLTESFKELTKLLRDILGMRWKVGENNMTLIVEEVLKIDPKDHITVVTNVVELLDNVKFIKSHC